MDQRTGSGQGDAAEDGLAEAPEGALLTREHQLRERSAAIVAARKAAALAEHGRLRCEVCDFDFEVAYGELGAGFIECHHTRPVCTLKRGERTRRDELALICANCHRMIHRRPPWLTVQQARALVSY